MNKAIFKLISILLFLSIPFFAFSQEPSSSLPKLTVFYSPACHKCIKAKSELMPNIKEKFKGKLNIEYRDITDVENYKLLLGLQEKQNLKMKNTLPVFYLEGHFLNGEADLAHSLIPFISESLKGPLKTNGRLPQINFILRLKGIEPVIIISAGLIDGINPCAFTVIVFFISFLAFQGYKKRELIVIGLAFIFAVFLTYILVGLGIFRFLYSLRQFYIVSKIIYYLIAIFCFILSLFALYDLWLFIKSGKTEGMILQLPPAIKSRIHAIIGLHYRKTKEGKAETTSQKHFFKLIMSAFITGFLVSLLEAVCTGQLYLPTIAFVLKDASLRLRALGYLLLYNLMFIVPLLIVLLFALLGTTSEGFSNFIKNHMATVKLSMAIIFLGLGILILIGA